VSHSGGGEAARMRLTPEFRLFCLAVRQPQHAEDIAALRRELAAGPNWDCLIEGASRHRVSRLLLDGLQACGSPHVPANVIAELRRQTLVAARHSLAHIAELVRLSRIFARAEIRVLALKGVVLSAQLYGDPALRNPRDIDLLVDPEEFDNAEALLVEAGYRRYDPNLSPRQRIAYRRWIKEVEYIHVVKGICVELHHRLHDNLALMPWDFGMLWRERE
jgi:Uncharacterised nucleotidyltransferase